MPLLELENRSPFPALVVKKYGYRARPFDVLVVRGSFDIQPDRRATPCDHQASLVMCDEYAKEPPEKSFLLRETDLILGKQHTDVHVLASAHAPEGKAAPRFGASIAVGPLKKSFVITGPRRWERHATSWRLTDPTPTEAVPLTYEHAYGGAHDLLDITGMTSPGSDNILAYPGNGAGKGWLPNALEIHDRFEGRLKKNEAEDWAQAFAAYWGRTGGLPAHQIEAPGQPAEHIDSRPLPVGALPLSRFWQQRAQYAGTYDETWRREVWPSVPDDFDFRFYQGAHPDLTASGYLAGDESFTMVNLGPEGVLRGTLPAFELFVLARDDQGLFTQLDLRLDTIYFDLESRQLFLTWRRAFAEDLRLRHLLLAALVPPREPGQDTLLQLRREAKHG
jgi:hypothetical protein